MRVHLLIRFLNSCAITTPWVIAAFLAGLALGMWRAEIKMTHQYETRLEEAHFREDVTNQAMGLLIDNKFRVNWAKSEAVKRAKHDGTN